MSGASARARASTPGNVAPITRPMQPFVFHERAARATLSWKGMPPASSSCRSRAPGLEVWQSRKRPRPSGRMNGSMLSAPRSGLSVTASASSRSKTALA